MASLHAIGGGLFFYEHEGYVTGPVEYQYKVEPYIY